MANREKVGSTNKNLAPSRIGIVKSKNEKKKKHMHFIRIYATSTHMLACVCVYRVLCVCNVYLTYTQEYRTPFVHVY